MKKSTQKRILTLKKKAEELSLLINDEFGYESPQSDAIDNVLHMTEELSYFIMDKEPNDYLKGHKRVSEEKR